MSKELIPVYSIADFKLAEKQGNHFYINHFSEHLKQHDFIAAPHRHDFYLIVYFTKGTGKHLVDFISHDVKAGSIFFLTPGQAHNFAQIKNGAGTILFFSKEFLESYFQKKRVNNYAVFSSAGGKLLIKKNNKIWIENIFIELINEYSNLQENSISIIRDYLDILLERSSRLVETDKTIHPDTHWQLKELENLIELHFTSQHSPSFYAEKLHLSPKYLNELCKKYLDKTTTNLIHSRLILEAKRLLINKKNTITDIADHLGFEDASYFIRFFKKHEGISPKKFGEGN